jgi:disulfide bond formation protein DsbB
LIIFIFSTAFAIQQSSGDKFSYCGYSNANTGYRLTIAILTFIFSILLFLNVLQAHPYILNSCYWMLYSFWFLATGLDIVAIANGQTSCNDNIQKAVPSSTCDNSVYGVTIAVDVGVLVTVSCLIYFLKAAASAGHSGGDSSRV